MSATSTAIPHTPDPNSDPVKYLLTLQAIRQRTGLVSSKAKKNQLVHFDVDESKFDNTVDWVLGIIQRDYSAVGYDAIPPHGRWQHFDVGGVNRVDQLLKSWSSSGVDTYESARRLLDLFVVSVLLDAGAGNQWQYTSKDNGLVHSRSEGLAVASIDMFKSGTFSGDPHFPFQVDAAGLKNITATGLARGLQVSTDNPIDGLEGRTGLMQRLGTALEVNTNIFGETSRPGNILDYLIRHPTTSSEAHPIIDTTILWETLMTGLAPIWPPSRTMLNGHSLGDAWPCQAVPTNSSSQAWEKIIPFHKLTQWLCYSIMVPMQRLVNIEFTHANLLTGLPEYRNGGLLIDTGLITLKNIDLLRGIETTKQMNENIAKNQKEAEQPSIIVPAFTPHDDVIVEWRAVTVGYLDQIHESICQKLGVKLSLAQVLEAGTWKGGREIAASARPLTKGPPIMIISDGTVF